MAGITGYIKLCTLSVVAPAECEFQFDTNAVLGNGGTFVQPAPASSATG